MNRDILRQEEIDRLLTAAESEDLGPSTWSPEAQFRVAQQIVGYLPKGIAEELIKLISSWDAEIGSRIVI